eukprot:CAMPEP_0181458590 /NCGR_PEP_ID=MMETSP1110-20121109/32387_1 /TAXON_ID=174948 /ORGANISM="Symbiodinium sp., Strain CCMP421" /LENGTH=398 /DNA_ID=CAMNT_0023583081 /DNA_START=13 /DNA_END=1207 /DNA_ORIENTATION=-
MNTMIGSWLLCLAALPVARGHGQLTRPWVRQDSDGETESWRQRAPVYTLGGNRDGYSATSMRCHDFQPTVGGKDVLEAGVSFEATWTMEAGHPGDCYFYLSYDDPSNAVNFFKIAAIPGCGAPDGINIPSRVTMSVLLPAELPACDHCVLRWEWTAHQQVSDIEFYVQCADVIIRSTAGNHLPSPVVAISGIEHLPQAADGYRKAYQGEGPEEQYLVGPAVATFSPCSADTPGCLVASGSSTTFGFSGTTTTVDPSDTATTVDPSDTATTVNTLDTATTVGTADAGNCPHAGELPSFVSDATAASSPALRAMAAARTTARPAGVTAAAASGEVAAAISSQWSSRPQQHLELAGWGVWTADGPDGPSLVAEKNQLQNSFGCVDLGDLVGLLGGPEKKKG